MSNATPTARQTCGLCGLAVGEAPFLMHTGDGLLHFCCPGCRQAYVISRAIRDPEFPSTPPPVGESHDA